jgi:L-asparagine oxygenase
MRLGNLQRVAKYCIRSYVANDILSLTYPGYPGLHPYKDQGEWARYSMNAWLRAGANDVEALIQRMERGELDLVRVRQVPIDERLPDTPIDGKRPWSKRTFVSESSILAVAAMLKMNAFGFESEKEGAYIHQVCPVPGKEGSLSNEGSGVDFGLHTEGPHLEHTADAVILLCLRGDPDAGNPLVLLDDVMAKLDHSTIDTLSQPLFHFHPGASYDDRQPRKLPILYTHPAYGVCIRWHAHNVTAMSAAVDVELQALRRAIDACEYQSPPLQAGEMLVFNNRRVLHGRTTFNPIYDGRQRWLQRAYLTGNFFGGPVVRGDKPFVWRT